MSSQARRPAFGSWRRRPCGCRLQYGLFSSNTGAWSLELPCQEHMTDEHRAWMEDERRQEAEANMAYVRELLKQRQPAFAAALENLTTGLTRTGARS